jgi:hypothetical protein
LFAIAEGAAYHGIANKALTRCDIEISSTLIAGIKTTGKTI